MDAVAWLVFIPKPLLAQGSGLIVAMAPSPEPSAPSQESFGTSFKHIAVLLIVLFACMAGLPVVAAQPPVDDSPPDWPSVISRLRQETQQHPGLAIMRQQLAVALNNYGVQLADQGQWDQAKAQLQEAMRVDALNKQFPKNLANIYFSEASHNYEAQRTDEAKAAVEQAIAFNPSLARAYALLGEIEYRRQQLAKAKAAWEKAVELDPSLGDIAKRLEQVSEELPVESKFERLSQAYFDLRYEEQLERPAGFDVRDALLQARSEVGSDFAYWPKYKIVVLIYSAQSFRALRAETPDWVAGQFDGKIRVPLPSGQMDADTVKQILFHEYTHALVHDLALNKCPVWFNEGLAEYEGTKHGPRRLDQLIAAAKNGQLLTWSQLEGQFSAALPVDAVALGYQESRSVVQYLVDRYGFWRIRRVLKALADGAALEDILSQEFHIKPDRLEANWRMWLPQLVAPSS